jgi:NADPH:quinone reductase-like Zn-dependent oxidoreductase
LDQRGSDEAPWIGSAGGDRGQPVLMKAIMLTGYGDVDKLELREVPEPRVGRDEIKVRVAGASINPVDWKTRLGELKQRMPVELPANLGKDASGEVIELGPEVRGFELGARVLGNVGAAYAEQVVAKASAWAKIPANLDLVDAAAIPLVALTGAQLIEQAVGPSAGQTVLVTGALGSVGRAAVFVAKSRGVKVWAGVRRKQKDAAAKLGVEGVVAIDDDAEIAALPSLDAIADTIGGEAIQKLYARVRRGGTIGSTLGKPAGAEDRGFVVREMMTQPDPVRLANLAQAVADRRLVLPIAKRFPVAQVREAQRFAEHGAGGKVVLVM